jgi:hypothetical protein
MQNTRFTIKGKFDLDELFAEALKRCPKLTFIFKDWEGKLSNDRLWIYVVPVSYNYNTELELKYEIPYRGFDMRDVIEDDGDFNIIDFLKKYKRDYKAYPENIPIATLNPDRIWNAVNKEQKIIYDEFQGLDGIGCSRKPERHILLNFKYKYDTEQLYNMEVAAKNEADKLIKILFGTGHIPPFLKVFLSFSYVQQNCKFDSMYIEALKRGMKGIDVAPELPFSVLGSVKKHAVSKGVSSAITLILTMSGVECVTIEGKLFVENSENDYFWNMVKLNNVWYHLDAMWYLDNKGINIARFMCNDKIFFKEHRWYEGTPDAKGCTFNYDYIEEYINENFDKLVSFGIQEKYLRPEEIYD